MSAQQFFWLLLLLFVSSCAQPPLIEDGKLNQNRIDELVSSASSASGLRVIKPLSVKLLDRTELYEILRASLAAKMQSDSWAARQVGQTAMGFPPADAKAIYENLALLARSSGGLYVPGKQTLYVIAEHARSKKGAIHLKSHGALSDEITLVHEVIHALQHMHYPELFEPDDAIWQQQTDAATALRAAIEGDATLWAAQSLGFLGRARDPEEVLAASREGRIGPLRDAPAIVREVVVFPYTYGYRFAYHEGKKGLDPPPASTEQIIHLERSGRREILAINLADYIKLLEKTGCRVLFQDTMGEFRLSLWLRSFDSTTGEDVWQGWDGDRWIAASCENSREVAWLTSWDTEQDAHEFENKFAVMAADFQRRADLQSPLAAERQGREVIIASGGLWPYIGQLKQLANRARVTTRAELAAHFAGVE